MDTGASMTIMLQSEVGKYAGKIREIYRKNRTPALNPRCRRSAKNGCEIMDTRTSTTGAKNTMLPVKYSI